MKHTINIRPTSNKTDSLNEGKIIDTTDSIYRQTLNNFVIDLENMPEIDSASASKEHLIIDTDLEKKELINSVEYLFKKYWERIRLNEEYSSIK